MANAAAALVAAGAAGILFPRADGRASVHAALESAKYPPEGKRGLGGVRANRYGSIPLDQFVRAQVAGAGSNLQNPPVNLYTMLPQGQLDPKGVAQDFAQDRFIGRAR